MVVRWVVMAAALEAAVMTVAETARAAQGGAAVAAVVPGSAEVVFGVGCLAVARSDVVRVVEPPVYSAAALEAKVLTGQVTVVVLSAAVTWVVGSGMATARTAAAAVMALAAPASGVAVGAARG